MAKGLVPLVSPMGSAGIVQDGKNGLIRDPKDHDGWAEALRVLAADADFRAELSKAARETALDYTWEKVGQRRLASLAQFFQAYQTVCTC